MAQSGIASTYHDGHPTGYTAAHRSLPFGAKVLVTNKRTVKIADSYPHIRVSLRRKPPFPSQLNLRDCA
jgi:hypothetical protein